MTRGVIWTAPAWDGEATHSFDHDQRFLWLSFTPQVNRIRPNQGIDSVLGSRAVQGEPFEMKRSRGEAAKRRWRELIEEQKRGGQGVREFAAARGLSPWSLYKWRRRLRRDEAGQNASEERAALAGASLELVAVEVVEERVVANGPASGFEVCVGAQMSVRVPSGFDAAELTRLLQVVRRMC